MDIRFFRKRGKEAYLLDPAALVGVAMQALIAATPVQAGEVDNQEIKPKTNVEHQIVFTKSLPVVITNANKVEFKVETPRPPDRQPGQSAVAQRPPGGQWRGGARYLQRDGRQCVVWARAARLAIGRTPVFGQADRLRPNSDTPQVGSAVLLKEGRLGHVALVVGVTDDTITIVETNYRRGWSTERTLPRSYGRIRGYIS